MKQVGQKVEDRRPKFTLGEHLWVKYPLPGTKIGVNQYVIVREVRAMGVAEPRYLVERAHSGRPPFASGWAYESDLTPFAPGRDQL